MLDTILEVFCELTDYVFSIIVWGWHDCSLWGSSFSKVKQLFQWWTQAFMIPDPVFSLASHGGVSTYAANMEISLQLSFPHLGHISNPGWLCLCSWLFPGWAEMRQLAFAQISLLTLGNHVSSGKLLSFLNPSFIFCKMERVSDMRPGTVLLLLPPSTISAVGIVIFLVHAGACMLGCLTFLWIL